MAGWRVAGGGGRFFSSCWRWILCILESPEQKDILWVFPKIGIPQNGWFIMETPIKMDDLGGPLFSETSICSYQTRFVKTTCSFDFGDIMTFSARTRTLAHTHTHTHTLWQKLRHQVPKSWKKMFHFISYAATPSNKTEGQQFKPKLVTKQTPSTEPKVNSFNKSSYVYTGSIQCLRWPLTVYFPSGPLRAKMGCGRSDRSSKASTGFTSFEKVHTHTHPARRAGCSRQLFRPKL